MKWSLRLELAALHKHGEVLAVHPLLGEQAEDAEDRGRHVVGRGEEVARLAGAEAFGVADHERYVRELGPERVEGLAREAVLPEGDPVVGEDDDRGVVEAARRLHAVHESARTSGPPS